MKRITLSINGRALHVYIEGDCDRVELGKKGLVPMQRTDMVQISDVVDYAPIATAPGKTDVTYEVVVGEIEEL